LDSPVTTYLPELAPRPARRGGPVTVRHLVAHRSGLVREPPVGHHFDRTSPSLDATVGSLTRTSLIFAPGERTKFSNAGTATTGLIIERVTGERFARHLARVLFEPM